jgi:hypothetical protein
MKTLCKYLGGSHLYGMNTPASDVDERGVFMNTDPLYVYGYHRLDNQVNQTSEKDVVMHELSQFLKLATKSNTQTLECLFAPHDAFTLVDPSFAEHVLDKKERFLNTDQLFKSLEGYLYNEMRLALGERTGLLGSKRKNQLDKHGFSPKNFSHLFRLAECGRQFFLTGVYPVRLKDFNPDLHDLCMSVKVEPDMWSVDELKEKADALRVQMRAAYEAMNEADKYKPDLKFTGEVLHYFYSRHTSK